MQKNNKDFSLQTIYIKKNDIKTLNLATEKKALRHYLSTIEIMTRTSFFTKGGVPIASKSYIGISKNSFAPIFSFYEKTSLLNFKKGLFGRISFKYPDSYPRSLNDWISLKGGFLKVDREELLSLIHKLSDNELRVYFALKLISEANYKDLNKELGITTYPKAIRENHVGVSQKTLKSCLESLENKELVTFAEPIDLASRLKSRFLFCLVSQKIPTNIPIIPEEIDHIPENSVQLKESNFRLGISLNQGQSKNKSYAPSKNKKSDFNFWGLDRLDRPLTKATITSLVNSSGLTREEVQESVMRFSRYINSDQEIRNGYHNPVGFLVSHMKSYRQIFVQPEWWLELQHRNELGKDRFNSSFKEKNKHEPEVNNQSLGDFFSDILSGISSEELAC